jgi:hypothetical protein
VWSTDVSVPLSRLPDIIGAFFLSIWPIALYWPD